MEFQVIPRTFIFCTKNNTMAILLKTASAGLVPFKSYKLESKTRAKVFGKVDTTEMYQAPQKSHAPTQTNKELATNAIKELSIPSRPLAKVRCDRDSMIR